ncbi:hypothetical protein [Bradyrhizobium sp. AZCC 1708]|uniref:hypothetical protein n=1 Tax=Bradyrhizobium sp. AZCC 1708 TaxID=3117015 RepID=UPI002FF2685B
MSMDTSMTVGEIEARIGVARERLAVLDNEAQSFALPAVSGDQDAAAALARINAEVRQVTADVAVLDRARISAAQQRRDADEAAQASYRASHIEYAQDRAAAIVRVATRVDDLVAELKAAFTELSSVEREIWIALREANAPPSDAVVGRKSLGNFAIASLTAFTNGTDRFGQTRAVADVAAKAWAHLLTNDDETDA